ncbi:alpha/beta hydrolase [Microbacterium sp. RD1]|uniref:alpha/beta hydrolase n=1 Tax=Microbacterium sp. RD1 TaxID=3457313 RepID=UPI003FA53A4F
MTSRAPVDADIAALIDEVRARPAVDPEAPIGRIRTEAVKLHAWMRGPVETELAALPARDEVLSGVRVRWYGKEPTAASDVLIFVHGGGWLAGDVDSYDNDARRLAARSGEPVVSVEYRRTPEHVFPAAIDDCVAVVRALGGRPHRTLSIVGDSAGGNLALGTAVALSEESLLTALLLLYPVLDPTAFANRSYTENGSDYLLTADAMRAYWSLYAPTPESREDPVAAPRFADLDGLPATVVVSADYDPLRDEARELAGRLVAADVPVTYLPQPGLIHGFQQMVPRIPAAARALEASYAAFLTLIRAATPRADARREAAAATA